MDINNDTNISSLISHSISKLNLNTKKIEQPKIQASKNDEFKGKESVVVENNAKIKKVDVEDIQKYAASIGETLSTEDINYGLIYGRSVIADYSI